LLDVITEKVRVEREDVEVKEHADGVRDEQVWRENVNSQGS